MGFFCISWDIKYPCLLPVVWTKTSIVHPVLCWIPVCHEVSSISWNFLQQAMGFQCTSDWNTVSHGYPKFLILEIQHVNSFSVQNLNCKKVANLIACCISDFKDWISCGLLYFRWQLENWKFENWILWLSLDDVAKEITSGVVKNDLFS